MSSTQTIFPEWFVYPSLYPELWIGFSFDNHSAEEDARIMQKVYKHCYVEGIYEYYQDSKQISLKNSDYHYYYSSNDNNIEMEDTLFYVDGFCTNVIKEDLVLAYTKNYSYHFNLKPVEMKSPDKVWLNQTSWWDDTYYYGIGMFTSIGNDSDAWKKSEEQAIFNLLSCVEIKIQNLDIVAYRTGKEDQVINYQRLILNHCVEGIETIERRADFINKYYYTMVRVKKAKISTFYK